MSRPRCSSCGKLMRYRHTKLPTYICDGGCASGISLSADDSSKWSHWSKEKEQAARHQLQENREQHWRRVDEAREKNRQQRDKLEREIKQTQRKINKLTSDIEQVERGADNLPTYEKALARAKKWRSELETKRDKTFNIVKKPEATVLKLEGGYVKTVYIEKEKFINKVSGHIHEIWPDVEQRIPINRLYRLRMDRGRLVIKKNLFGKTTYKELVGWIDYVENKIQEMTSNIDERKTQLENDKQSLNNLTELLPNLTEQLRNLPPEEPITVDELMQV